MADTAQDALLQPQVESSAAAAASGTGAASQPTSQQSCFTPLGCAACALQLRHDVKHSSAVAQAGTAVPALEMLVILPFGKAWAWAWQLPACGLLFRCGCSFPWSGGVAGCNIHNPSGPKCPWCNAANTALSSVAFLLSGSVGMLVMALVWLALLLRHRAQWKLNPAVSFTSLQCAGQRYAGAVAGFFLW